MAIYLCPVCGELTSDLNGWHGPYDPTCLCQVEALIELGCSMAESDKGDNPQPTGPAPRK